MRCFALTLAALGVIACNEVGDATPGTGHESQQGNPGFVSAHTEQPAGNGQTGSIGAQAECYAGPCAEFAASVASELAGRSESEVELRHNECRAGQCLIVVRIGDACHALEAPHLLGQAYGCELSDAEILQNYLDSFVVAPAPQCPSAGGGVMAPGGGVRVVGGGVSLAGAQPSAPSSAMGSTVAVAGGACVVASPQQEACVERAAAEWQGLKVCSPYPPCDSSARCGLARACIDGLCQACTRDEDCANGEGCVLDHCLLLENIACRSVSECPFDSYCYLSGYTGGTPRANEDMRAYCGSRGGPAVLPMR